MTRFSPKVEMVTGVAKGIGEATARLLAEQGATVIIGDVDQEAGAGLADRLGVQAHFLLHDVREERAWIDAIGWTVERFSRLDILVNNAGVVAPGTIESQTEAEYRLQMAVSADGTFFGCKHAIPVMARGGGGAIVNVASIASHQGESCVLGYSAAKGAVEAMTRSMAVYCGLTRNGVRCNSIHPSGAATPMVAAVGGQLAEAGLLEVMALQSGGRASRLADPIDMANAIVFLASDEARFINGAALRVDNGMSVIPGVMP